MKEELEQKIHEFAEQMYKTGYEDGRRSSDEYGKGYDNGIDVGYLNGLNDACECIKKISKLSYSEREELFDNSYMTLTETLEALSPSEIIEKIKKYEEKQKQTEEWDSETMCGQFYENDEGIKKQMQTDDELCNDFDCAYNHAGDCRNVEKCDDFKPISENKKKTDDNKIKVGDGVVNIFGKHGYVTGMDKDELYILYPNGEVGHSSTNTYVKDGRYFSRMTEVLKQMEGEVVGS